MLALYRRSQLELALWRVRVGDWARRAPPPEFVSRIGRLAGQASEAADGSLVAAPWQAAKSQPLCSPLDAVMVWAALELEDSGLDPKQSCQALISLRGSLARALVDHPSDCFLATAIAHRSPYSATPETPTESVIGSWQALAPWVAASSVRIVVLPIGAAAMRIVELLKQAEPLRPGPKPAR